MMKHLRGGRLSLLAAAIFGTVSESISSVVLARV